MKRNVYKKIKNILICNIKIMIELKNKEYQELITNKNSQIALTNRIN